MATSEVTGARLSGAFETEAGKFRVSLRPVKPRQPAEEKNGPFSSWSIPWKSDISKGATMPGQGIAYVLDRVCVAVDTGGPSAALQLTVKDGSGQISLRAWTAPTSGSGGDDAVLTLSNELGFQADGNNATGPLPFDLVILPSMSVEMKLTVGPFPAGKVSSCVAFSHLSR